ncbi:MAG TPA: MMPL family transporter, partial [Pirellulales bacterium]
ELEKRARQVVFTFLPASIAIGMLCLYFSFRTWRTLLVAVIGSLLAILLVLGWLAAGGGTIGVVTVATPALISIIGVASTMHFAEYGADYGTTGETRDRTRLVSWVAVPCLGAAATTAVGFLMLVFNELGPVRDLGMQLFVGSLLAFFGIFLVSQLIPIRNASQGVMLTHSRFRRYTAAITTRPFTSIAFLSAITVVLLYFSITGLHVNADPFSFFNKDQPIARALAHFSERRFGVYMLDVVLVPKEYAPRPEFGQPENPVFNANRKRAAEFSDIIIREGKDKGVMRVVSTEAFLQRQHKFQEDLDRVRREEGWAAFAAKAARVANQSSKFGDTFQSWSKDKQKQGSLRLTFLAHDQGINGFGPLLELTKANLPRDRFDCYLCGSIAQVVDLGNGLTGGIVRGLGSSILIIAALCGMMFRSVKLMLLALPPNLFPVLVLYGVMGIFEIPLSAGSAMVATIALGIAVNDTMHFVLHYQRFTRDNGFGTRRALVQTIGDLGRPIVLTSIVHIAGFTVFLLTDFQPLFHFGLLSSAAMVAAMLGDLFMLPNLLMLFDYRVDRPDAEPAIEHHAPRTQPQSIG